MKRILALILFSSPLVLATAAQATIVRSMNLQQMTQEADVVVHGKVVRQSSSWDEKKSRIYTVTELEVVEALKGKQAAKSVIKIRQIGGTVDGISQTVVGNASLKVGEEVVLFLDADENKPFHYVIGMAQGKYAIDRSAKEPRVARSLKGLALADVQGKHAQLKPNHDHAAEPVKTLQTFKADIRAAIAR